MRRREDWVILGLLRHHRHIPAKAFSLPVNTIAPTASSSSNFFKASLSSSNKGELSALRAFGRLRVTVRHEAEYQIHGHHIFTEASIAPAFS